MHNEHSAAGAPTGADRSAEVGTATHPVRGCQHETRTRERCQADSSERPLRRRADRIARPARVRMRSRKPCVLARRRLFGWKVRLLTCTSPRSRLQRKEGPGATGTRARSRPRPASGHGATACCQAWIRYVAALTRVKPKRVVHGLLTTAVEEEKEGG